MLPKRGRTWSPGGPIDQFDRVDGRPIGVANDLQASLVDARVGVHALTVSAPGYRPTTVLVRVVRDWATRVRLQLIPTY